MKIKLLFQGDSITDAERDRSDIHNLGYGYAKYAAKYLEEKYPQVDFEFINLGIGGNQTGDLVERLDTDFIDIQPDIISVMIGINDVWHYAAERNWLPHEVFEAQYRTVLSALKEKTNAKIMMIEPFLVPVEDKHFFRQDLAPKIELVRKLAREYADVYMPADGLLQSAIIGKNPLDFAADGVHLTAVGSDFIGKEYTRYISPIIDGIL